MLRSHRSLTSPCSVSGPRSNLNIANCHVGNTKKKETSTLTKEQLRDIREKTEKGLKSEAIVIKQDELERMKGATKIQTKEAEA